MEVWVEEIKITIKLVTNKLIQFTDSTDQMDTDAEFRILSPSRGVTAKFNGDGSQLIVRGNGTLDLELSWNDNPSRNGKAVGNIRVAGESFKQTAHKNKGSIRKTIQGW